MTETQKYTLSENLDAAAGPASTGATIPGQASAAVQSAETQDRSDVARRTAILVLGMHRSGTSAITRVISLLGADLPSNLMPAAKDDNETGFWESMDAYQLNDEILSSAGSRWDDWRRFNPDWTRSAAKGRFKERAHELLRQDFAQSSLFVFKDPRICRLLPFWLEVLGEFDAEPKCVLPIRNPLEVSASLRKRDGFSPAKSFMMWLRHVLDAEYLSRGLKRAFITYHELLGDWRAAVAALSEGLEIAWPSRSATAEVEIDRFLLHRHRHHAIGDDLVLSHPEVSSWVKVTYAALKALRAEPESVDALNRLDTVRMELDRASDSLGVVLRSEEMAREEQEGLAKRREVQIGELERTAAEREARIGELEGVAAEREGHVAELERTAVELEHTAAERKALIDELEPELASEKQQRAELLGLKNQLLHRLNGIQISASWQLARPLRAAESRWPRLARGMAALPRLAWWMLTLRLPERLRLRRTANELLAKGLFDLPWYIERNPDVVLHGINPVMHWLLSGWREGRDPSPHFDTNRYLALNPDAANGEQNPLTLSLSKKDRHPDQARLPLFGSRSAETLGSEPVVSLPFNFPTTNDLGRTRLAVFLHAFHPELVPEFSRYLANIPIPYDLFISTDTHQKADFLKKAVGSRNQQQVEIKIVPNRGRDVAPKLIAFREAYETHDLVLHLHTKTSGHDPRLSGWRQFILDCLLGSHAAVASVLKAFALLPTLGLVAPRNFSGIRPYMVWESSFADARDLAARMEIGLTPDSPLDFPAGSMFWARSAALKPLVDLDLRFEDFPEESGQTDGTLAHAVERLYFYACEKAGFRWVHAGVGGTFAKPETPVEIRSVSELPRLVSDQMPAVLLPGVRPRPTSSGANQPDAEEKLKRSFRGRCANDLKEFLRWGARLEIPSAQEPEVSVLLVLFNQAELSFHCLQNLPRALDVPAEVIILDNGSSDLTAELLDRLDGPQIIRSDENLHFLRGVNRAAAQAQGSYLLLLNNDTRVKPGSIAAACNRLENEPDVGAVGGKLVLLDGSLQEAGSIIWRDGSCLGYGRGRDPGEPEFQFRRDVDYCSGAFLMVRRDLFEHLGRFDTAFSPAYYEETDLCMRIRDAGFRVVYEPRVEVSHFEFGSSDSADVAIELQQKNRSIFVERHRHTLETSHLPPEGNGLEARMRERGQGRILVVDDRVPFPSLGAGYPRAAHLLEVLSAGGWFITLFPLVFPETNFRQTYEAFRPDIEILAGYGEEGLAGFLRERTGYYDAVIVSRPHNMDVFAKASSKAPAFLEKTPLIYDAEAIVATREAAREAVQGTSQFPLTEQRRTTAELKLARSAGIVFAVNDAEAEKFRTAGHADVRVLGHALTPSPTPQGFAGRRDLLFVGALDDDDSPNVDSLIWFAHEVMPLLSQTMGQDWVLNVVGRDAAPRLRELDRTRVRLLGRVEDLTSLYDSARVFIAPTRFAAGVPMKVHEAAAFGLPVVGTSVLAIQLGWTTGNELLVADTPTEFAEACQRIYEDGALWEKLRNAALKRVGADCNPSQFCETLLGALTDITQTRGEEKGDGRERTQRRNARVNDVWSTSPAERAEKTGWYWMAHPAVQSRLNVKVSGDPGIDTYRHLSRFLDQLGWQLPVPRAISLGCGFGVLERKLSPLSIAERIDAFDLAEGAILEARRLASEEGLDHIHYHVMDLEHADLPEGSVDLILAHQSVHHIDDLDRLFRKVHQALRPGGVFHLHEFVGPTRFQWTTSQLEAINAFHATLPEKFRRLPSGQIHPPIIRPTVAAMIDHDPSEAVRSSDIIPCLERHFEILERRDLGGALLHLGLGDIAQNFTPGDPEAENYLREFFALEDRLMEEGTIGTDFTVITAKRA